MHQYIDVCIGILKIGRDIRNKIYYDESEYGFKVD